MQTDPRPVRRILIANRGEIAIRIARTLSELGLTPLAVYAPEDGESLHLQACEAAVRLPGQGVGAYLDGAALIAAAQALEADAVHPGYGFLSESAAFAQACQDAGLIFIGPSPQTLALFGDKVEAIALARQLDLLTLASRVGDVTLAEGLAFLHALGGPVMVKALGGGGGRGMRRVDVAADLEPALKLCRSEALAAFGDGRVFLEQAVVSARHVEVQLIGDGVAVLALGDRDCTLQRRGQKLMESAPAHDLSPPLRQRLHTAAETLGRAAGLRGLATVEFLLDRDVDLAPYFIEVNARLQVEHTVTEAVTGLDLVELQVEIAAGAKLIDLFPQGAPPASKGLAIQLRVALERLDAEGLVHPGEGRITTYAPPSGPGIRVDGAGSVGYLPPPGFDSLIAKLIVVTPDESWSRALAKARWAVSAFRLEGPCSNLGLLQVLLDDPQVQGRTLDTVYLDRHTAALVARLPALNGELTRHEGDEATPPHPNAQPLLAPMSGILVARAAEPEAANPGVTLAKGVEVAVIEAMKMHHPIALPAAGRIVHWDVEVGAAALVGRRLGWWVPGEGGDAVESGQSLDLDAPRADLTRIHHRYALIADAARPKAIEKRHAMGLRSARENIADLLDPGSFQEIGALVVAAQRRRRTREDLQANTPADGMVAGLGLVNGELFGEQAASVAVLAYDYTVLAGTQGYFNHKKTDRLLDMADHWRLPVVFYVEGGGGRPGDVDAGTLIASSLDTTSFTAFARLSGKVPRISIVAGRCFAGNAVFLGCADIAIGVRGANIGLGGPAMIEGGGLGVTTPDQIGPAEEQFALGVLDLLCADEAEATAQARALVGIFQGRTPPGAVADQRRLRHVIPEDRLRVYDVRAVIETLADEGSFIELRRAYGPGLITGFVRIDGWPFGLIANDPKHLSGAIDASGAEKGGRFLRLCDAFNIPVLSLCDTPGFMVGLESERTGAVRRGSRLFVAAASLRVPIFTVVTRKAYGLGAQAMAGGDLTASATVCAWPTGEFGPMGLEGAVRLGYRKELEAETDPTARQALYEKLVAHLYAKGQAEQVAEVLEIDAVIDPAATRDWILRSWRAARQGMANGRPAPSAFVDVW